LKPEGTLLVDSDMIQNPPHNGYRLIQIPATSIASKEIGNSIVTNLVILGALIGTTRVVSPGAMEKAVHSSVPKSKIDINLKAFRRGLGFSAT
jgi:2-oxoglutarate ferredoxin oxidoreductase subunit gamma